MAEYHRVDVRAVSSKSHVTAEDRYWRALKPAKTHKHFVKVAHLTFAPSQPHLLAACASTKVSLYDPLSLELTKSLTRFKDVTLASSFRSDGKLLATASNDGVVQLFDLSSRIILRQFKGHSGPVWNVSMCSNYAWLYSVSDDKSVRQWDVASQSPLRTFSDTHADYVRMLGVSDREPSIIATGGFDGIVKYWDCRVSDDSAANILTVNHGAPITAMTLVSEDSGLSYSLLTASEASLKAFDTRITHTDTDAITTAVHSSSPHTKSITGLCLDATNSRILTSSLDAFIKVTSAQSFETVSSLKYISPLLCMALSPDNSVLATGTADGSLTLRQRSVSEEIAKPQKTLRPNTREYFTRGIHSTPSSTDYQIVNVRKAHLRAYDLQFKKFQYHGALDSALRTGDIPVIVAVIDELIDRQALNIALSGRTDVMLAPILSFLTSYLTHPSYTTLCLDVINTILTMYSSMIGTSILFDEWCVMMAERIDREVSIQGLAVKTKGAVESVWQACLTLSGEHDSTQSSQSQSHSSSALIEHLDPSGASNSRGADPGVDEMDSAAPPPEKKRKKSKHKS